MQFLALRTLCSVGACVVAVHFSTRDRAISTSVSYSGLLVTSAKWEFESYFYIKGRLKRGFSSLE